MASAVSMGDPSSTGGMGPALVRPPRESAGNPRRDDDDAAVLVADDLPAALMHIPVMPVTKQSQVGRLIRTTVDPVPDVVSRGPARRPLAARPGAAPVAHIQCLARRS